MNMSNMRTPKEKEKIVKDLINGKLNWSQTIKKYNLSDSVLSRWRCSYLEKGIEGLRSNTGKHENSNGGLYLRKAKNKIEELELEILKKDIEIARLKKGYAVKGVGAKKEFITTFSKNIK